MSPKAAPRLAWTLWALTLAQGVATATFLLLSHRVPTEVYGYRGVFALVAVSFATVGAVVASRRPAHPLGWLFLATGVLIALQSVGQEYGVYAEIGPRAPLPGGPVAVWLNNWLWVVWVFPIGTFGLLLFPDGRLPSPRWRPAVWLSAVAIAVEAVALALKPGPLEAFPRNNPFGVSALRGPLAVAEYVAIAVLMLCLLLCVASAVVRRRRADPETRARLRWFLLGGSLLAVALLLNVLEAVLPEKVPGLAVLLAMGLFPVALGIGILRHRLFDIEVVIRKAIVYGLLTAVATGLYLLVVVAIPAVLFHPTTTAQSVITIVSTAGLTLALLPLRRRATRLANRLVYGARATPYEVLSEFSERVGGAYSTEDVLPRMARLVVESTGADRGEVWLRLGDAWRLEAVWPPDADSPEAPGAGGGSVFEVRHREELLGALALTKPASDPVTPSEEKLLGDLAAQAGLVLRNVRLTEELRANLEELRESRRRIVSAQDAERRRLERDIHDGAQQHLVALAVKLRLAKQLATQDPDRAATVLDEAAAQTKEALETLRDLARGIYPPLLADQGLAAALEAQARKIALPVEVHPDGVGRYPQEAEAAVYFCVLEALQNVAKYADASRVDVRLSAADGELRFEVSDDGRGFDVVSAKRGSGTQNMSDRLEALGGRLEIRSAPAEGTTVAGSVPVEAAG